MKQVQITEQQPGQQPLRPVTAATQQTSQSVGAVSTTTQSTVQEAAAPTTLTTDPALQAEELLRTWRQEKRRRHRPRQLLTGSLAAAGVLSMAAALMLVKASGSDGTTPAMVLMLLCIALITASVSFPFLPLTGLQVRVQDQLKALDDVRASGPLLEFVPVRLFQGLYGPDRALLQVVIATLTRLLTQMNEQEAAALLRPHSAKLYGLMETMLTWNMVETCPDLLIALVRLLPALADQQGLSFVAMCIMRDAPTHDEQRLRETAREALPLLLARVDMGGLQALSNWIQRMPAFGHDNIIYASSHPLLLSILAFMQLLPQMTPADFLALSAKDRQRLYASLLYAELPRLKVDFGLVVLDMVRRSADVEALSTVRDLIDGLGATPYPQVRQAARDCLPLLTAQVEKDKLGKTLLRGASAPQGTGDTLLRPAEGAPTTDPQLLLRASVEEGKP